MPVPVRIAAPVDAGVHDPGASKLQKRRNAMERVKNSAMAVTRPWRYPTGIVLGDTPPAGYLSRRAHHGCWLCSQWPRAMTIRGHQFESRSAQINFRPNAAAPAALEHHNSHPTIELRAADQAWYSNQCLQRRPRPSAAPFRSSRIPGRWRSWSRFPKARVWRWAWLLSRVPTPRRGRQPKAKAENAW